MRKTLRSIFTAIFLYGTMPLFSQNPVVAISSYFNAADPRDEWTELLVTSDNVDMRNWTLQDNNSNQTAFQTPITFNNIALWNNLRAGTVIMIWHRSISSLGVTYPIDFSKQDGYIEVSANDPNYFNGGNFGTSPLFAGNTLNIAGAGDLLELLYASGIHVHALGHKTTVGTSWGPVLLPKLNFQGSLASGDAVFVCPGKILDQYGTLAPQDGIIWASSGNGTAVTFGLPNTCTSSATDNSDFWRGLRQPGWPAPSLTGSTNAGNTQVTLNWAAATDPFPADVTQGYMILRNTANTFGTPIDGHTYIVGDNIGGAAVIALITSSQTLTYVDNIAVPCATGLYYRVYAYRYTTDEGHGNDYDLARGKAYNETSYGATQVTAPLPVAPVSATSDRNNFCANDPGNITLSATGGTGTTLNWYTVSCGGTLLGPGSGANNSITIPSPTVTTTYYARWENACGNSTCASVTVTVLQDLPVSVIITASQNPVCPGTLVTYTAAPVNPGTAPVYQWKVNGVNAGTNSATFAYTPVNGDNVSVVLTSNETCTSGNPATSNTIVMNVTSPLPVSVTISADPGDTVCAGTTVTYTATPVNGGTTPSYQWFLNGTVVGGNSPTWSNVPADGDVIYCKVTSDLSCAINNPATSNTVVISITSALPAGVSIAASPGDSVCAGTTVTYAATPVNGGVTPSYQWFLNGTSVGGNSPSFSNVPVNGDAVYCKITSSNSCASNNPATSNTITISIIATLPAGVNISANPGDTVCTGTTVNYTAIAVNGGSTPSYQWFLNGAPVGGNSPAWSNIPSNGDVINCQVTSSFSCATNNPATSGNITIVISSALPVSVGISANPGDTICAGTPVTFTATSVNGGSTPVYQWYLNGTPTGTNNKVFTTTPANGDAVYCRVTSSLSCATGNPAISPVITIVYSSSLTATVTVTANPTAICEGSQVTFTASATNQGSSPLYEWLVNGAVIQQGASAVYSTTSLSAGQTVACRLTSSLTCLVANPVTSPSLTIPVLPTPVVTLTDQPYLCAGETSTLDAGRDYTSYLWQDNSTGRYFDASDAGLYWVTVTDSLGCKASDTVLLKVCDASLFMPNAFTPDGDGLNDEFRPVSELDGVSAYSMIVFNRWGQEVFSSDDIQKGWNGTVGGKPAETGTYVYTVSYQTTSQGVVSPAVKLKGTFVLVR
ncbi:MAG: gliding motility-associated C-terminal domain-containing protein [Bacteroidetes bacterium]|nr:gliding motility-associated C-terminal domain-containing protein [Bacteroidota bacterium]